MIISRCRASVHVLPSTPLSRLLPHMRLGVSRQLAPKPFLPRRRIEPIYISLLLFCFALRCFDVICWIVIYFAITRFVPFLFWLLCVFVGVSVFSTCYAAELSHMVGAVPPSDLIHSMRAIDPCCAFFCSWESRIR